LNYYDIVAKPYGVQKHQLIWKRNQDFLVNIIPNSIRDKFGTLGGSTSMETSLEIVFH